MTTEEALISVWQQAMVEGKSNIELEQDEFPVRLLRAKKLRTVEFNFGGFTFSGIEQNSRTNSRWAELARAGNRIMQFRCGGQYIGNVCEGKLTLYSAGQALQLSAQE